MRMGEIFAVSMMVGLLVVGVIISENMKSDGGFRLWRSAVDCQERHPEWPTSACEGIADGRYTEQDVAENPAWDWETIGSGRIRVGMTSEMVEAAWGEASFINAAGHSTYDLEWACGGHLLRFSDGTLLDIVDAVAWSDSAILRAADQNAVDFENKTIGEYVFIVGRISDFNTTYDGAPYVEFDHPDYWDVIQCVFPHSSREEIGELKKGQRIVILGVGDGINLIGPEFIDCRVFAIP